MILSALLAASTQAGAITRPVLTNLVDLVSTQLASAQEEVNALLTQTARPNGVLQYALDRDAQVNSDDHGLWLQRGERIIWRTRFVSDDALSLSATLSRLQLPAGSIIRIADRAGIVHSESRLDADRTRFQTAIVPGDTLVVEVELPEAASEGAFVAIDTVQHGFRPLDSGAQKSGGCNIDTVCPQGDAWTPQIRSVARVTVDGKFLCSGVLLNNTARDERPLLLTADHCGLTANNANATVVYWNFESTSCGGRADGQLDQNQSGATLLASNPDPDFALIELDRRPPASFDVFYAGWDSRGNAFGSGVSVHHPSGDEKRISLFDDRPRKTRALVDGEPVQSWEVFWNEGITEPGSSGAPLFDDLGRVVGQLSGGNSSCDNPGGSDVYGRLDYGWDTSTDPAQQLQVWLDAAASGESHIPGLDPSTSSAKAQNDTFDMAFGVQQTVPLTVLNNDFGARPLRVLSATASTGQVEVNGQQLLYTPNGESDDVINYVIIDRNGQTSSAQAQIKRSSLEYPARSSIGSRGGSLSLGVLALLLLGAFRRRGGVRA